MAKALVIQTGGRSFGQWCKRHTKFLAQLVTAPGTNPDPQAYGAGMEIDLGMVLRDDEPGYIRVATCTNSRKGTFSVFKIRREDITSMYQLS